VPTKIAVRSVVPTSVATGALATFMLALALASFRPTAARAATTPADCRAGETAVLVDTSRHLLHLCERGAMKRSFTVSLGTNGVGKRRMGDNRTPLGEYPLGPPRDSRWFHTFVPVAYPTPEQARMGFTGSAIGIHGPPRGAGGGLATLAMLVVDDWTAGCIAVATDAEIQAIAGWIRFHGVKRVRLVA
jgi:hypothetical protein